MNRLWLSWSSGKDSAFTLQELRRSGEFEIAGLLTTVTEEYGRVSMHAVRESLLRAQAARLGLPLRRVAIPAPCPNERYEKEMRDAVAEAAACGVTAMAFGDLFLADIRAYRERNLTGTGIAPVFPLWGRPTRDLAREMIASGLRAILTCVDPRKLPARFAGREFDERLLADLPVDVDPCGENGEFHTFVYDSPAFHAPIPVRVGEVVEREGFIFADVIEA